jgi:Sigma-70 factor, region 1.1
MNEGEAPAVAAADIESHGTLRSLIARGKLQGYLIRSEAIAMLPVALFAKNVHDDILNNISDMGIPIVDAVPTAAELAAMQALPASEPPKFLVTPSPAGQPIGAPIVVLHVGAEGGEIRLIAQELTTGWRYRYTMLDQTDLWLEEGGTEIRRQSAWVYEWNDALAAMDRYPWAELHPLAVHPQFADRVLAAALERLAKAASALRSGRRLTAWSALCSTSMGAAVR